MRTKKKTKHLFFSRLSSQKSISVWKSLKSSNDIKTVLEVVLDHPQWIIFWKPGCNIVDPNLRRQLLNLMMMKKINVYTFINLTDMTMKILLARQGHAWHENCLKRSVGLLVTSEYCH